MKKSRTHLTQLEIYDLKSFLICILVIPLPWLFYGWRTDLLTIGHDGLANLVPYLKRLLAVHGDWTQALYRADTQGGIKIHDIIGTLPIFQLSGLLGFSITTTTNLTIFMIQVLYSFLGLHTITDLAFSWGQVPLPRGLARVGFILLLAFTPVLGWKLSYGHFIMVLGSFCYLSLFALFLATYLNRLSFTLAFVSATAMAHCFTSTGQQMLVYSIVFGGPVLLGVLFSLNPNREYKASIQWLLPLLLLLGALGVSMPKFSGMLYNAIGSDASRNLHHESVIYSYITAHWKDWISSIFWTKSFIPISRPEIVHHEINYSFGPMILALFLVPWKKNLSLATGLISSFLVTLLFSMDIWPVSDLLPKIFPPLKYFRVPERAMLLFSLLLPILGSAGVWYQFHLKNKIPYKKLSSISVVALLVIGLILYFATPILREFIFWLVTSHFLINIHRSKDLRNFNHATFLILILAFGSILFFQEKIILPFVPLEQIIPELDKIGQSYIQKFPIMNSPLNRVIIQNEIPIFSNNTSYMMHFSTIDGYWFPQQRFSELTAWTMNEPFHSTNNNFRFTTEQSDFTVLRQLYNICCKIIIDRNIIYWSDLGKTAGPAWFSQKVTVLPSLATLAILLKKQGNELIKSLPKETWIAHDDPIFKDIKIPSSFSPDCQNSKILDLDAPWEAQTFHIRVQTQGNLCPLTISTNFSSDLEAYETNRGQAIRQLDLFPSYGALTGVLVPANVSEITVKAHPIIPYWANFSFYLGLFSWTLSGWLIWSYVPHSENLWTKSS